MGMIDWEERLTDELSFVYGVAQGSALAKRLAKLAKQNQKAARPLGFKDPAEILLITYGDQVTAPDEPPLATLHQLLCRHAKGLISGVHILPFYPWSSDDGFSIKDFFAVDPDLGDWKDLRHLGADFDLMIDAVFNHASAKGEWFKKFQAGQPGYETFFVTVEGEPDLTSVIRPRALPLLTDFEAARGTQRVWTTFSADQADLNFRDPRVMQAVSQALLFYLSQGIRYVRLDAIGFIWKESGTTCLHLPEAHALVRAWRALADGASPGAQIVTETNVPHLDNIAYFGNGENEARMVYNFALPPLVLHTLTTGNASALTRWASQLKTPSENNAFFNFLASHDGIGLNPARGILSEAEIDNLVKVTRQAGGQVGMKSLPEGGKAPYELNVNYFDVLAVGDDEEMAIEKFTVAHAIALALAGVPGIYFHSFFGSRGDREGARISGIPRRINREKFQRADLEKMLAHPRSRERRIFDRLANLLRQRQTHPAFAASAEQKVVEAGPGLFALERGRGREKMLCLHEIAGQKQSYGKISLPPYGFRWIPSPLKRL